MKSARKVSARRRSVRRPVPLTLSQRVERLEKTFLFPSKPALTGDRFTNLCADGSRWMDAQDGKHVAVHDSKTGLTWSAEPLQSGKEFNHADAMKACAALDLLGKKDWRAPTIEELLSIVDYTRCDPAVDTDHFLGPYAWTWSSTLAKAPAGYAWLVNLDDGDSDRGVVVSHYHVRAVRSGQQLGLLE